MQQKGMSAHLQAVAGSVRTLLGPQPGNKIVTDGGDGTGHLISDVSTLLDALEDRHPAVLLLKDACKALNQSARAGAAWMIVLAGLLAGAAERLQAQGISRRSINDNFCEAAALCKDTCRKHAVSLRQLQDEATQSHAVHRLLDSVAGDIAVAEVAVATSMAICSVTEGEAAGEWAALEGLQPQQLAPVPARLQQQGITEEQAQLLAVLVLSLGKGEELDQRLAFKAALLLSKGNTSSQTSLLDRACLRIEKLIGPASQYSAILCGSCLVLSRDGPINTTALQQAISKGPRHPQEGRASLLYPTGEGRRLGAHKSVIAGSGLQLAARSDSWQAVVISGSISGPSAAASQVAASASELEALVGASASGAAQTFASTFVALLLQCRVSVVFAGGLVDSQVLSACSAEGVLVISSIGARHAESIAEACGIWSFADPLACEPSLVGTGVVLAVYGGIWLAGEQRPTASGVVFGGVESPDCILCVQSEKSGLRGTCERKPVVTALLCGHTLPAAQGLEARLLSCLAQVQHALREGMVLPGAGAIELLLAATLDETAANSDMKGLEGWKAVLEAFAGCLRDLPCIVQQNSGEDYVAVLKRLSVASNCCKQALRPLKESTDEDAPGLGWAAKQRMFEGPLTGPPPSSTRGFTNGVTVWQPFASVEEACRGDDLGICDDLASRLLGLDIAVNVVQTCLQLY